MNRRFLIAIVAVVAIVIVAAGILASGVLNPTQEKTIRYLDVPPVNQQAFIEQGRIDGGVSWEPYVSDSVAAGTANVLIRSGDIWPDHPCCVVVANTNFLNSNPETAAKVVKAHIEANLWIANAIANKDTNPENYELLLEIGSEFSDRDLEVIEMSLENMKLTYNITAETVSYLRMFTNEYLNATLIQSNRVPNVDSFVNNLVDTSYLEMAKNVMPVAEGAPLETVRIGYLQGDLHQYARVVAEDPRVGEGRSLFETYGIEAVAPNGMPGAGYANGGAVMTQYAQWDMAYLGSPPVLLQSANQGIGVRILALANTEGSALLVAGDRTIDDLGGLTIGQPGPSSIQYLLLVTIAEKYGYRLTT